MDLLRQANVQEFAEKQKTARGIPLGPNFIQLHQALFREIVIRGIAHPFLFRHKSEEGVPGGLERFHDILKSGKGGIIVDAHYSQIDPPWSFNDSTKKHGLRNIKAVFPIRKDHAPNFLLKIGEISGAVLVRVVTPDLLDKADKETKKTGIPHNLKETEGFMEYRTKAKKAINNGELAIIGNTPTRSRELTLDPTDSLGKLIFDSLARGRGEFGIHFYASKIPNTKDYGTRRRFNQFKRHIGVHGVTLTGNEIWERAEKMVPAETTEKKARRNATLSNISRIVFEELSRIADPNYLSSELRKLATINMPEQIASEELQILEPDTIRTVKDR